MISALRSVANGNTGIVPPYIPTKPAGNTGIVPSGILASPIVRNVLQARVTAFLRGIVGPASQCPAPVDFSRLPSLDVTPAGTFGVSLQAYACNNHFLLAQTATVPGAQPRWFDLGVIPPVAA